MCGVCVCERARVCVCVCVRESVRECVHVPVVGLCSGCANAIYSGRFLQGYATQCNGETTMLQTVYKRRLCLTRQRRLACTNMNPFIRCRCPPPHTHTCAMPTNGTRALASFVFRLPQLSRSLSIFCFGTDSRQVCNLRHCVPERAYFLR